MSQPDRLSANARTLEWSAASEVLKAPSSWGCLDFISDLHLQSSDASTAAAFFAYLRTTPCDALFVLGDLLEVWVGDDSLQDTSLDGEFWRTCSAELLRASERMAIYFLPGNRDFLVGAQFLTASGMRNLRDPTVLEWHDKRWLLSHGDALCLDDVDYQSFREQVRKTSWQADFLARSLSDRMQMARTMRERSEALKTSQAVWADADTSATLACLEATSCTVLIHGHTHQPATHLLAAGRLGRWVLSDWDAQAQPPRLEVLRADAHGKLSRVQIKPL